MKKRTILAIAVSMGLLSAFAAEKPYNVAVLPAWRNWKHVHDFDPQMRSLNYTFTNCLNTVEQMDYIVENLDKYDLLLAPPLFGYLKLGDIQPGDRPYDMKKYAPKIAKWIQDGGCFLGVDMNYPMAMEWFKEMDPLMDISANVDTRDMKTELKCNNFGPPVVENSDSMLYFPRAVEPGFCWGHMVIPQSIGDKSAWKVIATCGHGSGFPTLVVRRWGKGMIVLSSTRIYVTELLQNIRVNQKFSQMGIFVAGSDMPDPLPGDNTFSFECDNNAANPFTGELELTLVQRVRNPDKNWDDPKDTQPELVDDTKSEPLVFRQSSTAEPNSHHAFRLDCCIPLRGPVHAVMKFRTLGSEGVIFDRFLTLPEFFAVSGPPYRSTVSASRRFNDVTFTTFIYPYKEDISVCSVDLSVKNFKGDVVSTAKLPAKFGRTYLKAPLRKNLPAGKYTIEGRLVKTDGGELVKEAFGTLDIMPDGPAQAAFDEDNTLIVEGEPLLPLGIYHPRDKEWSYNGFTDVANVGFNLVNIFGWMGLDTLELLRPIDAYCLWEQLPHRSPAMVEEQSGWLREHPSALVNYTMDEPPESKFGFVSELNDAWRKFDPYHPTFLASYQPSHFTRNAEISDILAPDPYPYSEAKGDDSDIALVARRVELARAASNGVNPVFCVPQAFGKEPPYIWRNMGLQAIVHGAKGLVWYAWNEGNPNAGGMVYSDELIAAAEEFLAQLKLLAPAILGDAANQPRMFIGGNGVDFVDDTIIGSRDAYSRGVLGTEYTIHGMACRDPKKGTRYLILVNTSKEPVTIDIPLPEAGKATSISGAFDDSTMAVSNGVAKAELGKFGSGIWYWDGPRPVMPLPMSHFAVRELPARRSGKTLSVAVEGGSLTNLQEAIDAAKDGDVIEVGEGAWGSIVSDNKLIDIVATGARDKTFIVGNGCRAATLSLRHQGDMSFETNTLVRGFTIMKGDASSDPVRPRFGGGVFGGTLENCLLSNNYAKFGGGAAFARLYNCEVRGNRAKLNGGGACLCKAWDCVFDGNAAGFDGGATEYSDVTRSVLTKNVAGRFGGATYNGKVDFCRISHNKAKLGGGSWRGYVDHCIIMKNYATDGAGGVGATAKLSFCVIAYNTIEKGPGPGSTARADNCLLVDNASRADPLSWQVAPYRHHCGENVWYAGPTTNYPPKSNVFDASVFADPKRGNFEIIGDAPFLDAAVNVFFPRDARDYYGNPRVSGYAADPGVFETMKGRRTFIDADFGRDTPLTPTLLLPAPLVSQAKDGTLPTVADGALVLDGTCGVNGRMSLQRLRATKCPRLHYEIEFAAESAGPLFSVGWPLTVSIAEDGKMAITTICGARGNISNRIESAESVIGKGYCKLVVDTDRFGGTDDAVKATLNGKPLEQTLPFTWTKPEPLIFTRENILSIGCVNGAGIKGCVKSFKLVGEAD